jgi:O-antigen ligase
MAIASGLGVVLITSTRRRLMTAGAAAFLLSAIGGYFSYHYAYVFTSFAGSQDVRVAIWMNAWQATLQHPWLGAGGDWAVMRLLTDTAQASGVVLGESQSPHNLFLVLSASFGLPALLLWLAFMTLATRPLWQPSTSVDPMHDSLRHLGWRMVAVLLVAGFFTNTTQEPSCMAAIYLALAYVAGIITPLPARPAT